MLCYLRMVASVALGARDTDGVDEIVTMRRGKYKIKHHSHSKQIDDLHAK